MTFFVMYLMKSSETKMGLPALSNRYKGAEPCDLVIDEKGPGCSEGC
jgi:hypothetical protein